MSDIRQNLNDLGLEIPSILLPRAAKSSPVEMQKWPVIACDQFTQDRDYWERVKVAAEPTPSTINLIFPEVFLSDGDMPDRISLIHSNMASYLREGVFSAPRQGFIYLERDTPYQRERRGLIAAIDLERYEWNPKARSLIRSTEGTVEDRLPPRMEIRRGAPLELPHVLLLIDDDTDTLLPELGERAKKNAPVYKTSLMMESGSVTGWFIDNENDFSFIAEKLDSLKKRSGKRYESGDSQFLDPFLFAVGDGNHSLAAAKGVWEEYKAKYSINGRLPEHPCRYALVEIENIYDPAIQFEPIHRIIFGIGFNETVSILSKLPDFASNPAVVTREELSILVKQSASPNCFGVYSEGRCTLIETSAKGISTASLQPLLDEYIKDKQLDKTANKPAIEIDYIHDEEELFRLAESGRTAAGILLPPVKKAGLFETVANTGPLPRKSFSMGHSCEKRFYLECRALF